MWRHVGESFLVFLVFVAVVTLLVRVHFRESFIVNHAAAERLIYDRRAPGFVVDVVEIGGLMRAYSVAFELAAACTELKVDRRLFSNQFDAEFFELLGVLKLLQTGGSSAVVE